MQYEDASAGLVSPEAYSDCLSTIYDCALDPALWPTALEKIGSFVNGLNGVILLIDTQISVPRFHRTWNVDPESIQLFNTEFLADNPLVAPIGRLGVDEPYNVASMIPTDTWEQSRLFRDFGKPRGFKDHVGVTLMRSSSRLASLAIVTSDQFDYTGARELKLMGLIAPHARRALAIGDLIELRSLSANAVEQTLNALTPAVVLIDRNGGMLFANDAARQSDGLNYPLSLRSGRVEIADRVADTALQRALADWAQGAAKPFSQGVRTPDGRAAFIHALPIERHTVRAQIAPSAAIALFITMEPGPQMVSRDAWSGAFGLTSAETAVLGKLLDGLSIAEAANVLCVSMPTIRTHLARLYQKTGTTRHSELVRLAASLQPPVRPA